MRVLKTLFVFYKLFLGIRWVKCLRKEAKYGGNSERKSWNTNRTNNLAFICLDFKVSWPI